MKEGQSLRVAVLFIVAAFISGVFLMQTAYYGYNILTVELFERYGIFSRMQSRREKHIYEHLFCTFCFFCDKI